MTKKPSKTSSFVKHSPRVLALLLRNAESVGVSDRMTEVRDIRWDALLSSLEGKICEISTSWVDGVDVVDVLNAVVENLADELLSLKGDMACLYGASVDIDTQTKETVDLLRRWHYMGRPPSLTSLSIDAITNLGLKLSDELLSAVLMASILGEIENENAYHNNMHFRKVLLQTLRLIVAHNDIYKQTDQALDDQSIAMLILAACIHDIGHDGKGNMLKGQFIQGRLEQQSFELAKPYLKAVGLVDEDILDAVNIMLLTTDTAPLGELSNAMNQMKAAFRYHFMGGKTMTHALNLDEELSRLPKDAHLALLCLLLHEADIATSAGLTYEMTKYETASFMRELRDDEAYPEQIIDFLNQICQKRMLSDAAQRLYGSNLARIYALAEQDVRDGNHALPSTEHSDFMLAGSAGGAQGSTTIN